MDEQLLTMNEREQEKAEEARKRADNTVHKRIYAEAMAKWRERRQMLRDAGVPMARAGDKPLLYQIKAGNYSSLSNTPPNQEENTLNLRNGRHRQPRASIDSITGEEVDIGDTDSGDVSEAWSAHDKSNYLST